MSTTAFVDKVDAVDAVDETALVMEALKMVHGQTMMRPTLAHLKALHNSHVRTNRELLEMVNTLSDQADSSRRYLHMAANYFKGTTTAEAVTRFLEVSKATVKKARELAGKLKGAA